jgi:hypothetical protein
MRRTARIFPRLLPALLLPACAGYRSGWESYAYVGEARPAPPAAARTPYEAERRSELSLPGLRLRVSLDNAVQTLEKEVCLYVIPVSVDPRDSYRQTGDPARTRLFLSVTPADAGFVFRPALARLGIGATEHRAARATGPDGEGELRLDADFALAEAGRTYRFVVEFDVARPSPRSEELSVDFSRALRSPRRPPLPPIRFLPARWRESYS